MRKKICAKLFKVYVTNLHGQRPLKSVVLHLSILHINTMTKKTKTFQYNMKFSLHPTQCNSMYWKQALRYRNIWYIWQHPVLINPPTEYSSNVLATYLHTFPSPLQIFSNILLMLLQERRFCILLLLLLMLHQVCSLFWEVIALTMTFLIIAPCWDGTTVVYLLLGWSYCSLLTAGMELL